MTRQKSSFLKRSITFVDIILTIDAYFIAYFIRNKYFGEEYGFMRNFNEYLWVLWVLATLWPLCFNVFNLYSFNLKESYYKTVFKIFTAVALSIVSLTSLLYFMKEESFSRLFLGIFAVTDLALILVGRTFIVLVMKIAKTDKKHLKKVLIIGTNSLAEKFTKRINENPGLMVDIVGYVQADERHANPELNTLGYLFELENILKSNVIDEVVFALPKDFVGSLEPYVQKCESMGITVNMALDLFDLKLSKSTVSEIGNMPMVTFHTVSLNQWQLFLKRVLDVVGASVGLLFTAISFVIFAPIIYLESPGPIFFSQDRVGKNGRIFKCYKFRSMYMDAEERKKELMKYNEMKGNMFKIKNDPRITRVGKFIRATSIDELPQFWNVLKGDMSLVGTRPPTMDEVEKYETYHWRRLSMKPGITGMWQVSGRSTVEDFEDIVRLDTSYIDNWSIWVDIRLLLKTVQVVLFRSGAC